LTGSASHTLSHSHSKSAKYSLTGNHSHTLSHSWNKTPRYSLTESHSDSFSRSQNSSQQMTISHVFPYNTGSLKNSASRRHRHSLVPDQTQSDQDLLPIKSRTHLSEKGIHKKTVYLQTRLWFHSLSRKEQSIISSTKTSSSGIAITPSLSMIPSYSTRHSTNTTAAAITSSSMTNDNASSPVFTNVIYGIIGAAGGVILIASSIGLHRWRKKKRMKEDPMIRLEEGHYLPEGHSGLDDMPHTQIPILGLRIPVHSLPISEVSSVEIISDLATDLEVASTSQVALAANINSASSALSTPASFASSVTEEGSAPPSVLNNLHVFTIAHDALTFGEKIGEGGFGAVYHGRWGDKEVAIKQLHSALSADTATEFKQEAAIMAEIRYKEIVEFYGICTDRTPYCMVMAYMPKGSLYATLHSGIELSWATRLQMGLDIAHGLNYLHHQGIVHRDLKSLNVLLDGELHAKLTDFGLSKVKQENETQSSLRTARVAGSILWMAPELFKRSAKNTKASDVYSFGMTLSEIATRKVPFEGKNSVLVPTWVTKGQRLQLPEETPAILKKVITSCWKGAAVHRPKMSAVVRMFEDEELPAEIPITVPTAVPIAIVKADPSQAVLADPPPLGQKLPRPSPMRRSNIGETIAATTNNSVAVPEEGQASTPVATPITTVPATEVANGNLTSFRSVTWPPPLTRMSLRTRAMRRKQVVSVATSSPLSTAEIDSGYVSPLISTQRAPSPT